MNGRLVGEHLIVERKRGRAELFFRGTRIAVADVLDQVAQNKPRHEIIQDYQGVITAEGITEAVRLAGEVFLEHARVPPKDVLDAPPTIYGEYVLADPAICHGKPTFRGSRVFVTAVLEEVAVGMESWDRICWQWNDSVTHQSIAEAVRVAMAFLDRYVHDLEVEPVSA